MVFTIITSIDDEVGDYIAEIKELNFFGSGENEIEAIQEVTELLLDYLRTK